MSIVPAEKSAQKIVLAVRRQREPEMRIYSHSTIFYWWPV
jgi:hypothetical protein